jgi:putative FmdB family regulatory protein
VDNVPDRPAAEAGRLNPVPVYLFRCTECAAESELLLPLGQTQERSCEECGAPARHRFARVAVKYNGWGFAATDNLIPDTRGKDFNALRETAEKISDE